MHQHRFVAIGHITNDLGTPDRVGGAVAYTAVTAQKLGFDAHIVTKCPQDHPHVRELREYGVTVHILKSATDVITTFENSYDDEGNRTQRCPQRQETIGPSDFLSFPISILEHATILVAPVADEVDPNLFPLLQQYGTVSAAPQGYLREIGEDGTVRPALWDLALHAERIRVLDCAILSEEDLEPHEGGERMLAALRRLVSVVILTRGAHGSTVFTPYRTMSIPALPLQDDEIADLTGAGDTYAAAFLVTHASAPIRDAAFFASYYAGVKLFGFGERGVAAAPSETQLVSFAVRNYDRAARVLGTRNHVLRAARQKQRYMEDRSREITLAEASVRLPSRGI